MIEYSDYFLKEAKKLSKKYKLLKTDLKQAVNEITNNQDLGVYSKTDKESLTDEELSELVNLHFNK